MAKETKRTCFVVTPIGKPDSEIRRHIDGLIKVAIKPALGEEYDVKAAHNYLDSMSITKQVYEKLYESDLVIVNLTGLNPNVMYELGIRFCFGKPVILIAQEGEQLPFDITEYRTMFYKDDALGFSELKEALEKMKKTIKYTDKAKSPIHDALRQSELFKQLKDEDKSNNTTNEALSLILEKINTISNVNKKESFEVPAENKLVEEFYNEILALQIDLLKLDSEEKETDYISRVNRLRNLLKAAEQYIPQGNYNNFLTNLQWCEDNVDSMVSLC